MKRNLNKAERFDFWFNNPEFDVHDQFGANYYVNTFYKDIVLDLDIPKEGYIVVMGTARAVSFDMLCDHFGAHRCIGYDLHNPSNHPRVRIKDCMGLTEIDNLPIAFAHNDIGSLSHTPELKINTHKWLLNNVIDGGYVLGNNNFNRAKFDFEGMMSESGFENIQFADLGDKIKNLPIERVEGYMLSRRKK